MQPNINDPAYHDAVRERLGVTFGQSAMGNAMRHLLEDARIKPMIPQGALIVGQETDDMTTAYFHYLAIATTFNNLADPEPPGGEQAKLFFMSQFMKDERIHADHPTRQKVLQAMSDCLTRLREGDYDYALN